jgi:hypothetical protein
MSVREIPPREWRVFLEEFSRDHRAWLASVERVSADAECHVEVRDRPLGAVTADTGAPGIAAIQIRFQEDSHAGRAIRVDAPLRLSVEEAPGGAARVLDIENDRGERTRVRLRVVTPPGLLDGVAAGELD